MLNPSQDNFTMTLEEKIARVKELSRLLAEARLIADHRKKLYEEAQQHAYGILRECNDLKESILQWSESEMTCQQCGEAVPE